MNPETSNESNSGFKLQEERQMQQVKFMTNAAT